MARYLINKLLWLGLTLFGVVTLLFAIFTLLGDPSAMIAGQRADKATLEAIRKELGVDQPIFTQYLLYLRDLSPLDALSHDKRQTGSYSYLPLSPEIGESQLVLKAPYLRRSFLNRRPVTDLYFEKIGGTAFLAISSLAFATFWGVILGCLAGRAPQSPLDRLLLAGSLLGVSVPSFLAAVLALWVFAVALYPITGLNITGYVIKPNIFDEGYTYEWKNLLLPAFTLGIRPLAIIFQLTRDGLVETLRQDYIRTARAKGLSETVILLKHALRPALNPVVTSISGWFASLLAGAFFIEYLFDWQGVGKLTIDALNSNDYPVVLGCCLWTGVLFALINLSADFLYAAIDPRAVLK